MIKRVRPVSRHRFEVPRGGAYDAKVQAEKQLKSLKVEIFKVCDLFLLFLNI